MKSESKIVFYSKIMTNHPFLIYSKKTTKLNLASISESLTQGHHQTVLLIIPQIFPSAQHQSKQIVT